MDAWRAGGPRYAQLCGRGHIICTCDVFATELLLVQQLFCADGQATTERFKNTVLSPRHPPNIPRVLEGQEQWCY